MAPLNVFGDGSFLASARIGFKRLTQPGKMPVDICTRQIASAVVIGSRVRAQLKNVVHRFTIVEAPFGAGSARERTFEWYAGGGNPYPDDPMLIDCYQESDTTIGSPQGGVRAVDAGRFSISGLEDYRVVLTYAKAFDGDEASDWGATTLLDESKFRIGGFFSPNPANLVVPGTDRHGRMAEPITGNWVTEGSTQYARINQVNRPAAIPTHCFWFDEENNCLLFSPHNDGANITIRYSGTDGVVGDHTEGYTIDTDPATGTGMAYATYTGADATSIRYADGDDAGNLVLPPPTESNSGGQLMLQFDGNDAGRWIIVRAEDNVPSDSPSNGVTLKDYPGTPLDDDDHGYKSYGKKQDVVEWDLEDFPPERVAELTDVYITFSLSDAVMLPFDDAEWRVAGGTWTSMGTRGVDWVGNGGSGSVWPSATWFTGKPANLEFRVPNAKYVDHRGFLPASVMIKILGADDALRWVYSGWAFSDGPPFKIGHLATQHFGDDGPPMCGVVAGDFHEITDPDDIPDVGLQGHIQRGWDMAERWNYGSYKIVSQRFGPPEVLPRPPDGWTIERAYCTLSGGGVTRVVTDGTTNPATGEQDVHSVVTLEGMPFVVLALYPGGGHTVLAEGTAVSGSTANNIILEAGNIVAAMLNDRDSGSVGYAIIPAVDGLVTGSIDDFILSGISLPPAIGLISPPGVEPYCDVLSWHQEGVGWGPFSLGELWIKFTPAPLEEIDVPTERYPVLSL